ncbi:MAG: glycosyltransferase [Paludibacteraceae bacterium]
MSKIAIVCVTNDLTTDQRVRKTCMALMKSGYDVIETGRLLSDSLIYNPPYSIRRPKLWFNTGALFYAEYNVRLFFYLLFAKVDLIYSNDLDTLPAAFLASRIRGKKLIYDTHEYFTEMPELVRRKRVQAVWKKFEKAIFPKLENIITVNYSIANLYSEEYHKKLYVVRNIPPTFKLERIKSRTELDLPEDKKILIMQGTGINIDRGGEEAVLAMKYLEDVILLVVGSGDVIPELKNMVLLEKLEDKVFFKPKMPFAELREYTMNADLGLALDKDTNINYRFSLPNKLFDFIHSGIPTLASGLPEIKDIIDKYDIGYFIPNHTPKVIADTVNRIFENKIRYNNVKENTKTASKELNWENEEKEILKVINSIIF